MILASLKKTNRIIFIDEDVPGGAAAYMFNKVMEEQGGYRWLDVAPRTLTAKAHRPAYASDGDYFSKPNMEEIIDAIQDMHEGVTAKVSTKSEKYWKYESGSLRL